MNIRFPPRRLSSALTFVLALAVILTSPAGAVDFVGDDLKGNPCRGNGKGQGPYDYRLREQYGRQYQRVVGAHFKTVVQELLANKTGTKGTSPYQDIYYTLRAVPNHPHALHAMMRYFWHPVWGKGADQLKTPPECFLQRAISFAGNDPNVFLLFGIYLHREGKLEEAEKQYRHSLKINDNLAEAHYNLGILLTDMDRFEDAKEHAARAYALGYPLPGLKRRLSQAGIKP